MLVLALVRSILQALLIHEKLQLNVQIFGRSQRYPRSMSVRCRMSLILFNTGFTSSILIGSFYNAEIIDEDE